MLSFDETIDSKYDTYWLSNDLHSLMIQENYINNILGGSDKIRRLNNLTYSADALSDVDLFETQINMTNWEFEPHVAMSTINATSKCNKNSMVKFPQYLSKISQINKNKREKIKINTIKCEKPKAKESASSKLQSAPSKLTKTPPSSL